MGKTYQYLSVVMAENERFEDLIVIRVRAGNLRDFASCEEPGEPCPSSSNGQITARASPVVELDPVLPFFPIEGSITAKSRQKDSAVCWVAQPSQPSRALSSPQFHVWGTSGAAP